MGLTNQWVWSPTSGNCFRRDALCLFADNPALQNLKTGTDLYFCIGINAVSGSVLIDAAVAVYRLHGDNVYSQRPQLNHVLCYAPGGAGDSNVKAKAVLIDHLIEQADRFVGQHNFISIEFLWRLWRLDCKNPDPGEPRVGASIQRRSRAREKLRFDRADSWAMADQGLARFALGAVEGDFRPGETSRGKAHAASLNAAAPACTGGQSACQAKYRALLQGLETWSSLVRIIELRRPILR